MRIGDLNKQVTIQYQTRVTDNMGGFTTTWVDLATVWAAIWPVLANEQIQTMQSVMVTTHRIRMRYRGNVKISDRIKYGNSYFDIVSIINPNMKNRILDLLCKEAS